MDYRKEHPEETAENVAEFIDAPVDSVTEEMNRIDLFDADYCYQVMTDGTAAQWYDALQNLYVKDGSVEATVDVYKRQVVGVYDAGVICQIPRAVQLIQKVEILKMIVGDRLAVLIDSAPEDGVSHGISFRL